MPNGAAVRFASGVIMENNSALFCGGLYASKATLSIEGASTFAHNIATGGNGGGMCIMMDSNVTVESADFFGNTAGSRGGGIYVRDSRANITAQIRSNTAQVLPKHSEYESAYLSSLEHQISIRLPARIHTASTCVDSSSASKCGGGLWLNSSSLMQSTVRLHMR